jgi:hypothetical protein
VGSRRTLEQYFAYSGIDTARGTTNATCVNPPVSWSDASLYSEYKARSKNGDSNGDGGGDVGGNSLPASRRQWLEAFGGLDLLHAFDAQ